MPDQLKTITLDLPALVEAGALSQAEAERLSGLRTEGGSTGALVSVLYIIGAIAAAAGVVLLKPTATTGLIIALICLAVGQVIRFKRWAHLDILALALGIGSAAGLTGWFVLEFGEIVSVIAVNAFATGVTLLMALLFRSRFLAALVPLGIGAILGSGGAYWHASYGIFVREPTITAVLFTVLTAALWWSARQLKGNDWPSMAMIAGRMSFIVANFGFWVGSLWGDYVGEYFTVGARLPDQKWEDYSSSIDAFRESAIAVHENVFAAGWIVFCIGAVWLGRTLGNRFLEVAGIVFFAINAFTQYFELFKDSPWALIFGGIALVGMALALVRWQMSGRTVA